MIRLPPEATATDVIDLLSDAAAQLVFEHNIGQITLAAFAAAHERVFDAMLPKMLAELDTLCPDLGRTVRDDFILEQNERITDQA